jgi:diaminopimelate decarboxylase
MDHFQRKSGILHAEDVPLPLIADEVGTPVYVYSRATLERHAQVFTDGLKDVPKKLIAFAVKSNPNLAVLKVLKGQGFGADVVSGGELMRALAAGIAPKNIVFSGVGKTREELQLGLEKGIGQFNIESREEGRELADLAGELGLEAQACLRINPDVDAKTHEKISTGKAENKFGIPLVHAREAFAELTALDGLNLRGVAVHIGSQLADLEPLETAFGKLAELIADLRASGHTITHADLGGGLGVPYKSGDNPPSPAEYGAMVARVTKNWDVHLTFEPGRVIAGNAGILLTRVVRVKRGGNGPPFVIVDAAMNDLARPALYGAWHDIAAVEPSGERMTANIVGPICETGDTFARDRECDALQSGDLAIFRTAGAYGATMASSYNSRGFVAEVLVDGNKFAVVADRIAAAAIMDAESVPEWLD